MLLCCNSGSFATQNLRFYDVKQPLLHRKIVAIANLW